MSDELPEAWKESIHFYLGISCARLKLFGAAKEEFLRAEAQAVSSNLPILDIYSWLAYITDRLGEPSEAQRYAKLAKPV